MISTPSVFTVITHRAEIDLLIAQVVDACARVLRHTAAFKVSAPQRLREIRDAGQLFALVQRSRGGRPRRNAESRLTDYARVLKVAGVSRPTARNWQRSKRSPTSTSSGSSPKGRFAEWSSRSKT